MSKYTNKVRRLTKGIAHLTAAIARDVRDITLAWVLRRYR